MISYRRSCNLREKNESGTESCPFHNCEGAEWSNMDFDSLCYLSTLQKVCIASVISHTTTRITTSWSTNESCSMWRQVTYELRSSYTRRDVIGIRFRLLRLFVWSIRSEWNVFSVCSHVSSKLKWPDFISLTYYGHPASMCGDLAANSSISYWHLPIDDIPLDHNIAHIAHIPTPTLTHPLSYLREVKRNDLFDVSCQNLEMPIPQCPLRRVSP